MEQKFTPEELIKRYLDGTCTPEEKALVESWHLEEFKNSEETPTIKEIHNAHAQMRDTIMAHSQQPVRRLWPKTAAAASVVLMLSAGSYFLLHKSHPQVTTQNDVVPFTAQAILKTGHKTIVLDHHVNGVLAQSGQTIINKTAAGQLTYSNTIQQNDIVIYDTLQVPAGGRPYLLKLADGSRVTLNVASTLRFPETFRKDNSQLELIEGEGYFEIKHNSKVPISVKTHDQFIQDIGTEFNVSAYKEDQLTKTTLVEGDIDVDQKSIRPGYAAITSSGKLDIRKDNVDQTIAWKKGKFRFNGENIKEVMKQLARYYNVEVVYSGPISDEGYYLSISREKAISVVLHALEKVNKTRFKIEGRRIIVSSKS